MATAAGSNQGGGTLDFGRAIRFVPDDPGWVKKILIGGLFVLLGMLLIGSIFVAGYCMRLIRRAAAGEAYPLPEWDDLGGIFGEGLRAVGVYLIHLVALLTLPLALGCVVALFSGGFAAMGRDGEGAAGAIVGLGMFGLYAVLMVVGLLLYLYLPAALTRVALREDFRAGLEVRETLDFIRRNLGNYFLSLLLYLAASFVAQFGVILCCVGFFPASFWAFCMFSWCLGETARRDPVLLPAATSISRPLA